MTPVMDPKGDITDEFDDDSLRASIEKADRSGMWRDPTGFIDPKLEQLRRQLAEPERADYAERRRRDLQRKAAEKSAAMARAAAAPPAPVAVKAPPEPPPIDWRQTYVKSTPSAPERPIDSDALTQLQERIGSASNLPVEIQHPLLGYVRPVLSGFSVFLPITIVHIVVAGGGLDLLIRGLVASIGAGVGWNEFHAGRFRAPAIGISAYMLTFFTMPGPWSNHDVVANMVGFLMALLGSGLVGFLREQTDARGSAKD